MTRKTMAFVAVLALALLVAQGTALAALVRCKGGKCVGTEQADDLRGTVAKDQIFGLGGDDVVTASSSDDRVNGGDGRDTIFGEGGVDRLDGGTGADRIVGGDDRDTIFGGSGSDTIDSASDEGLGPVRDEVDCDTGFDTVTADRLDAVAANCEQVTRV
jgi:Ca2+-binding RTX toxin-like protein